MNNRKLIASRFAPNGDLVSIYNHNGCYIAVINDDEKTFYYDSYDEAIDDIAHMYY